MANGKFKKIMTVIGSILGTGAVGGVGFSFVAVCGGVVDSVCENLGTADPYGNTSAMSSEGSVGDLFSGVGDITTVNPVHGTTLTAAGAAGVWTTTKPDDVIEILIFWKDEMPYSIIERKADSIYRTINDDQTDCYSYPALIANSKDSLSHMDRLLKNQHSIGKMQETLSTLEKVLVCLAKERNDENTVS